MSNLLVRNLSSEAVHRLKDRARRNGRSLQAELKRILEDTAGRSQNTIAIMLDRWNMKFAGRRFSSTTAIIRQDRRR